MKKILMNGAMLLVVVMILKMSAFAQIKTGGYKSAATDDERVIAAANFAVEKRVETNTEQEGLTLDSVDKAEMQTVAGINYKLCLTVSLDDEKQQVEAVVYQNLKQEYSLTSWTVKDCGESESSESNDDNPTRTRSARYAPTNSQTKVSNCSGEQLSFSETEGEADMGGKRFGNYVFTNISSTPCALSGFPTFSLLDKSGQAMRGVKVEYKNNLFYETEEEGGKNPPQITLEPGKTAWFQIFYNDGMALNRKKPFPTSAKVEVKAPNANRKFVLKSEVQACCGVQVSSIRGALPSAEQ